LLDLHNLTRGKNKKYKIKRRTNFIVVKKGLRILQEILEPLTYKKKKKKLKLLNLPFTETYCHYEFTQCNEFFFRILYSRRRGSMPAKVFSFFFSTFCTEIITFNPSLLFVNKTDRRVEREGGT
jgi:hypothetical protein